MSECNKRACQRVHTTDIHRQGAKPRIHPNINTTANTPTHDDNKNRTNITDTLSEFGLLDQNVIQRKEDFEALYDTETMPIRHLKLWVYQCFHTVVTHERHDCA